jgi:hypothetical protein
MFNPHVLVQWSVTAPHAAGDHEAAPSLRHRESRIAKVLVSVQEHRSICLTLCATSENAAPRQKDVSGTARDGSSHCPDAKRA